MFRRNVIRDLGGYDESLPCYDDLDLYVRVAARSKIANVEQRLSFKRRHPAQFFGGPNGMLQTPEGQRALAAVNRRIAGVL